MPSKKNRVEIPRPLQAQVLFASDRTCCICRVKGKPVQIHHIDENPANNVFKNLAILCLDCHNEALAVALDDKQRYKELRKAEARSLSARPDTAT